MSDLLPFPDSIDERFAAFDAEHPEVWRLFEHYTRAAINAGRKHYSADMILARIRWHHDVDTGGQFPKLNDHFTSRYARKFHSLHPEHEGFFETRCLRSR